MQQRRRELLGQRYGQRRRQRRWQPHLNLSALAEATQFKAAVVWLRGCEFDGPARRGKAAECTRDCAG